MCIWLRKCYFLTEKLGIKFIPDLDWPGPDWPDPDPKWFIPDPAKRSGSDRIRIHNTGKNAVGTKREQVKGKGGEGWRNFCVKENMFPDIEIDRPCPRSHSRVGGGGGWQSWIREELCVLGDYIGVRARRGVSTVDLRTRENPTLPTPKHATNKCHSRRAVTPPPIGEGGERQKPSLGKKRCGD